MHWCAPAAHFSLVSTRTVVIHHPFIQIVLQLFNGLVNLAPECHLVELRQDGFVETLANTVGLRMIGFRFGMLNVIECQVELVIVILRSAAIFGATVGQDTDDAHTLLSEKWQYPVIEQVSRGDRCFGGI